MSEARVTELPKLSDDEWRALLARLERHALRIVGRGTWQGVKPGKGWGAEQAKEMTRVAITKAFEAVSRPSTEKGRHWNIQRYPTFESFVVSVLESEVSNAKSELENRRTKVRSAEEIERHNDASPESVGGDPPASPDDALDAEEIKRRMRAVVGGDAQLTEVLEGVFVGYERAELAELLGKDAPAIDNLRAKLKRRLRSAGFDEFGLQRLMTTGEL